MKKHTLLVVLVVFALVSMSCSFFNTVTNTVSSAVGGAADESEAKVDELWPDVPLMHGLDKADFSIPLPVRVMLNAFIGAMGQGGDKPRMSFMAYSTTTRSVQEIMDFYNPDLMAQSGWNGADQPGCQMATEGDSKGDGAGCFYFKVDSNQKGSVLAVVLGENSAANEISVFFVRFDGVDFSEQSTQ